jgi:hypothetical protein
MPHLLASRSLRVVLGLGAGLALAGCGGGGGDSGPTTIALSPSSAGTLHDNGLPNGFAGIRVGQSANESLRGGLRFPLFPFVDSGDTILSATLRVKQTGTVGSPYTVHGALVVDHVDFGASMNSDDHDPTVLASNIGTLSSDATLGFKELDVTAEVAAAVAASDFTVDFLLRFTAVVLSPGTVVAEFADHLGAAVDAPQLVVVYE